MANSKTKTRKPVAPVATSVPNALFTKVSRWIIKAAKTSYYQGVYTTTHLMVKAAKGNATYKVQQTSAGKVTELYNGADRNAAYDTFNKVPFSKCTYYNSRSEYVGKDGAKHKGKGWVTTSSNRARKG